MVIAAALLFAVNGTVSKVVLSSGISSLELTQVRATGAFVGFALVLALVAPRDLRADAARAPVPRRLRRSPASPSCSGSTSSRSTGCRSGSRSCSSTSAPILIALWARTCLHEPVRRRIWLALALALAGLALVVEVWSGHLARRARRRGGALRRGRVRGLRADGRARGRRARPRLADLLRLPLRRALLGARAARLALPGEPARRRRLAARAPLRALAAGLARCCCSSSSSGR